MKFFKMLGAAVVGKAGVKMVQSGSDFLINNHTNVNVFNVNQQLRSHVAELLANRFLNSPDGTFNEYDAALVKLAQFFSAAEHTTDEETVAGLLLAIKTIRRIGEGKIHDEVSLEVMGDTGA
jgi:hypothetical protein